MKWSEIAWNEIQPVYRKIQEMPFIEELMKGTLEKEKFMFYIRQDALYIAEYAKVLAGIATKLEKTSHIEAFIQFAGVSVVAEKALHESYFRKPDEKEASQASPSCLLYVSYLLHKLAVAPVEVIAAAVLPCFWIYQKVGEYILENQTKSGNPYQEWIDMYGGDEFDLLVQQAISICDELAENCTEDQQKAMTDAFIMCTKMEWLFWDSAWRMEKWPI